MHNLLGLVPNCFSNVTYTRENPYYAPITVAKRLTSSDAAKEVLHIELDVQGASFDFAKLMPGDAIGVVTENPDDLVEGILSKLGVSDAEQRIEVISLTNGGGS